MAQQLSEEQHDIVLVDTNMQKLQEVTEEIDAMTLTGNGASIGVQKEAGVEDADMLIAVTNSDELNLLCCLIAKKVSKCETVAVCETRFTEMRLTLLKSAWEFP